jgi:hypothetical protein
MAMGRFAEAAAAAEKGRLASPRNAYSAGVLAAALVRLGEKDRADALIREMGHSPTPIWGRAIYHLICSELELAASWYQKMIEARDIFAVIYAHSPYTRELRASPHWPRLAKMMNLPQTAV